MTLLSAAVLLFFVMDPLGNIPLFLAALRYVDRERRRKVIIRELLIALAILLVFLFAGQTILNMLQVSPPSLTIAGGIVLLLIAIRMIFPSTTRTLREETHAEPLVFPLAVPYTAGPSALATELLLMSREPERWPVWVTAVFLAWLASAIILYSASDLQRLLGERGLTAVERLMGMILVIVAIELLMQGAAEYLAEFP